MKIKVKSFNGELPKYLTLEKEYDVIYKNGHGIVSCYSDDGFLFDACIDAPSLRLNGGYWEVIE